MRKILYSMMIVLLTTLFVVAAPQIITEIKTSGWAIDRSDYVVPDANLVWTDKLGLWEIDGTTYLVLYTNVTHGFDFLWEVDSSGYVVLKALP